MDNERSIKVTERIFELQNFDHKKPILNYYVDYFFQVDSQFFTLFHNLIINEQQKGEIVEAMKEESLNFAKENILLLNHLESRVDELVRELESQINEMNLQDMTITYKEHVKDS
ncbi:hypothetical protein H1Z61_16455 [Bacillus aquiflavi]|uniref:Uncharacterized protein n=1 Tax=Bacillus aquiflavi TaxID=2672567 RepID=A0A6B3W5L2_9BACI|nr:hypothetical protein [Bacillus aquiflavi]MBA4538671.1 hypothetical protein [Bacillus aquiflavi]NEY83031.1 hypothetical protein [Bacillus aquiflavi]UAC48547.1 hypothetical protein K6959_00640 [Bacillus aquiflavi]